MPSLLESFYLYVSHIPIDKLTILGTKLTKYSFQSEGRVDVSTAYPTEDIGVSFAVSGDGASEIYGP